MVVEAIQAAGRSDGAGIRWFLGWAWMLGLVFSINKFVEYYLKIRAGITPATNSFFSFYYFITMVHFLHVIAGMLFIGYCRGKARHPAGTAAYLPGLENLAFIRHLVA